MFAVEGVALTEDEFTIFKEDFARVKSRMVSRMLSTKMLALLALLPQLSFSVCGFIIDHPAVLTETVSASGSE